jgi:hypothetical protein
VSCAICNHDVAAQSTYEFCRAKEVYQTTAISYRSFLEDYIEGVIGFPVNYQTFLSHVNNHVRPALRREIREKEIEDARINGDEWQPPSLSDFLNVPVEEVPQEFRSKTDKLAISQDKGFEPIEESSIVEFPEVESLPTKPFDANEHGALGPTGTRFWFESGDAKSQEEE